MPAMSKTADVLGDVPIRLTERFLLLSDTSTVSGVPEKSVRNWMVRDIIPFGEKHPITGRWMFSPLDALRLSCVHDLSLRMVFSLRDAARTADTVVSAALEEIRRDYFTGLVSRDPLPRRNCNVVAGFAEDGALELFICDAKDSGAFAYPRQEWSEDDGWRSLRRAHVVIPASAMLDDVLERIEQLHHKNRRAEAPTHD
jgi:hypothetical protein